MATLATTTQLSWAVPIDIITLVAHLKAELQLTPILNTLQLCNRFGNRKTAHITKIPAEVLEVIQEYLLQSERQAQREQCVELYHCARDACQPRDHVNVQAFQEIKAEYEETNELDISDDHASDFMRQEYHDTGGEVDRGDWVRTHKERQQRWMALTGFPGQTRGGHDGIFQQQANFILRQYGLRVWISHTQPTNSWGGGVERTIGLLTLPYGTALTRELRTDVKDWDSFVWTGAPEQSMMRPVALPKIPSQARVSRFPRAMKLLGLQVWATEAVGTIAETSEGDAEAEQDVVHWDTAGWPQDLVGWPKLMQLTRTEVERW